MDREWLKEQLEQRRSIESIGREIGRHPSTVAYWAQRYELVSAHAPRHAARGGIARETLEPLLAEGLTIRGIAKRLDVSATTVRHWLAHYGLETARASTLRATREGRAAGGDRIVRVCATHGTTTFRLKGDGYYRCSRCAAEAVLRRRARVRDRLVEEAGGRCTLCGYDVSTVALHFHHLDPALKEFTIRSGETRSIARMRAEAAKCVLLCANCHAEVEAGLATLP
jgi:DNA-directed RNA polymerase subunit RPC12/RpoP